MPKIVEGHLGAKGLRVAIVASRFNESLVSRLLAGAVDCLTRHGAEDSAITIVRVPGSFELPAIARRLAHAKKHDAIVALGVLIRGETPHFDLIAADVTRGLGAIAAETGIPVAFGVLTAESSEQAAERAGGKMGNRGWDAASAAIEMANLGRELG
ncbi:MAG TPA: 6,7-dimethyl-8-ribityllumazine synthase [Verrucomicrobiae bacterium]|nr:6,7-dimethyl-8-ribityllumazine synthase [Verrucomicrobiae bacterium]